LEAAESKEIVSALKNTPSGVSRVGLDPDLTQRDRTCHVPLMLQPLA
jgi:hypothetical protein